MNRLILSALVGGFAIVPVFVFAAQPLTLLSPNGGEQWVQNSAVTIQWKAEGVMSVRIDLGKQIRKRFYVIQKIAVGASAATGSYTWTVPPSFPVGDSYLIQITGISPRAKLLATDSSDAPFRIVAPPTLDVSNSPSVPSQNVIPGVSHSRLGGFDIEVTGEPVSVSQITLHFNITGNGGQVPDLSSIELVNSDGVVVMGPRDPSGTATGQVTLPDPVVFPTGKGTYTVRGNIGTSHFMSGQTITVSTNPATDWVGAKGQVSGAPITPQPNALVFGSSMNVIRGSLAVSLASTPTAQSVIRGTIGFTFANVILDATGSGEDVRVTSIQVQHNYGIASDLTSCQLFDGTTALNTGSNIVNPTAMSGSALKDNAFTLDTMVIVLKNTQKSLALKCNAALSGMGSYAQWALSSNEYVGATGFISGITVMPTVASSTISNQMTFIPIGSLTIALDSLSPPLRLARAGSEVTMAALKLHAFHEAIDPRQIAFKFGGNARPQDLTKITLWDGATKVGEVAATSSTKGILMTIPAGSVIIPKDGDKILTVRAELSNIGIAQPGQAGDTLSVDWDQVSIDGKSTTYGVGANSSGMIYTAGSDTASAGVRIFRAFPTVSALPVPTTSLGDASQKVLYRFLVSAPTGTNGVSLYKFTFNIATTGDDPGPLDVVANQFRLFAFTNSSFSGGAFSPDGQLNNGPVLASASGNNSGMGGPRAISSDYALYFNPLNPVGSTPEAIAIPPGSSYYFELRGDVSGADTGDSMTVKLKGDAVSIVVGTAKGTDLSAANSLIWSGNSTTTNSGVSGAANPDWTNGYLVPGLPSGGTSAVAFTL